MANEDVKTLATRKLVIAIARSRIGSHYVKGGIGEVPDDGGELVMLENAAETVMLNGAPLEWGTYFTAKKKKHRCAGRYNHNDVTGLLAGDPKDPTNLMAPDFYKWKRVVKFKNQNPLHGESCVGKWHFDCSGFVRWALKQVIPQFMQEVYNKHGYTIKALREMLEPVDGVVGILNKEELCAADILIRKDNGHIGFAIGDGHRVVQAEWEPTGVVETNVGNWEFHGRIPQNYWLNAPLPKE